MDAVQESELLDRAIAVVAERLPDTWTVEKQPAGDDAEFDLVIRSPGSGTQAVLFVETKSIASPRDVDALLGGPWRRWRARMGNQPILFIAPYLSPRVRERLTEEDISYIDLTGNTRISVTHPSVFIHTDGASRDPHSTKPRAGIRGAKAGAVVRVLADAAPPYTAAELAKAADVNEGYLSRILDTLTAEGLIDREPFGPIVDVAWQATLRRRAQALDLFKPNGTFRYVARQGTGALLESLRTRPPSPRPPTITGSFAASRLAPIAAPSLLVVYTMNPRELAAEQDLLEAEAGADTVLIRPDNDIAFDRAASWGGIAWAAPSQVAIDCLSGSGRMPSEGEALLRWMDENEERWRAPSISALLDDAKRQWRDR